MLKSKRPLIFPQSFTFFYSIRSLDVILTDRLQEHTKSHYLVRNKKTICDSKDLYVLFSLLHMIYAKHNSGCALGRSQNKIIEAQKTGWTPSEMSQTNF